MWEVQNALRKGIRLACAQRHARPQSVDSWDGGSTDELKKAVVEKKLAKILQEL